MGGKGEGQLFVDDDAEVVTMVKGRLVKLQLWDTAGQDGGFIRRWEWHGKRPHIMGILI